MSQITNPSFKNLAKKKKRERENLKGNRKKEIIKNRNLKSKT